MTETWLAQLAHTESSRPSRLETGSEPRLSSLHGSMSHRHSARSIWLDTRTVVPEVNRWRSELTAGSLEHSYTSIGQSSKEEGAPVFEAEDRASCRGQQDPQGLNGRVHATVHLDAVRRGTGLRTASISGASVAALRSALLPRASVSKVTKSIQVHLQAVSSSPIQPLAVCPKAARVD